MNEKIKEIQKILFPAEPKEWDGIWGPKCKAAFEKVLHPVGLVGDGTWPWIQMRVDGEDLVIAPGWVTAFGGEDDTVDGVFHGETASGLNTTENPDYIGCALPMNRDVNSLRGSPIPKLPWKTPVIFQDLISGESVITKLIDEGPAKKTKKIGDLTVGAAKLFDEHATANNFERILAIRITGGAKYL